MAGEPERRLTQLALKQDGLFTIQQAQQCGVSRSAMDRRRSSGAWDHVAGRVYALGPAADPWRRRVRAAVLQGGDGAAVSRYTALTMFGLRRFPDAEIDVVVPHPRHVRADGVRFHQVRDLHERHVVEVRGLPVCRPDRALVDLSAVMSAARLGLVFDEAVAARITTMDQVANRLGELMRPGKRRLRHIAEVLDERSPSDVRAGSVLEIDFLNAIRAAGIDPPMAQMPHPSPQRVVDVVDFGWPREQLLVEVDGRRWHTRLQDLKRDHDRDRAAAVAGWQTLRFLAEQFRSDRVGVIDDVRAALLARRSAWGHTAAAG